MGLLEEWQLSFDEINELLTNNPSLRSFVAGYAAELKCRNIWFSPENGKVSNVIKYDDHDRTKKGDIAFDYRGQHFTVEVKSLQTNSIKRIDDRPIRATFQCDASDRRPVVFPDGSTIDTTCLLVGEFDLLAVNLFGFYGEWKFAFAKNSDLPRVTGRGRAAAYTSEQREWLLASSMPMVNPPVPPYQMEPWGLLDELIEERRHGLTPPTVRVVKQHQQEMLAIPEESE